MSLPEYLEAYDIPTGSNEPHGIIYQLKNTVSNIVNYIVPSSNVGTNNGAINNIITWDGYYQTSDNTNAYVQIEFKDRYIYPTFYSFKSHACSCSYHKGWNIHGYNSIDETPELITSNTCVGSTFCGSGSRCNIGTWGTFAINVLAKKAYKYLRISVSEASSNVWVVMMGGFDVFGIYSKTGKVPAFAKPRKTFCFKSYPITRHFPISTIMKVTFICSI